MVAAKIATLTEIETYYDLADVLDANDALDIVEELDRQAWET